jgi:hypothetical protein
MSRLTLPTVVGWASTLVTLLTLMFIVSPARAQSGDRRAADAMGRVDFDFPDAPAATVAVDFKEGMLSAIGGIGKAAIQGAIEGLASHGEGDSPVQQSAEYLQAVNDIVDIASNMIREVRVRVYGQLSEQTQNLRTSIVEHYQNNLDGTNWDSVVRVHEDDTSVVVYVLQGDGAIHGLFVIVSEPDDLVMVNVVCELTPEKVKQITSHATQIGMKVGLEELIEHAVGQIHKQRR